VKDALLLKAQAAIMQKTDPRLAPAIKKTVAAGQEVMYSPHTRQMTVRALGQAKDPEAIGQAVAKLVGVLFNQSHKTLPMQVLVPAATLLLFEGLQFMEDAGAIKITPNFLAECTKSMGSSVLQLFGVTPDKLQSMVNQNKPGAQSAQPAPPAQASQPNAPSGIVAGALQ
jgi:hypothetical protein